MYILYSTRSHGYISQQGNYVSRWQDAKQYTRDAAMEVAKRHISGGNYGVLPINLEDLKEVV